MKQFALSKSSWYILRVQKFFVWEYRYVGDRVYLWSEILADAVMLYNSRGISVHAFEFS